MSDQGRRCLSLKRHPPFFHWAVLLALSLASALAFDFVRLPAALLLGAMLAAILVAIAEGTPRVARKPFVIAQGVVGCLAARSVTPEILVSLHEDWLILILVTLAVISVCGGMGWILTRRKILPGTTAIWGCSPGGASVMMLMSDAYGADMRLVAVMQYQRVVLVTILATVVSHFWAGGAHPDHSVFSNWLDEVSWSGLTATLLLAGTLPLLADFLKIPGGPILAPLVIGSILQAKGVLMLTLPPWVLAPAYITLGWGIGLRFTRQALSQALKALPSMLASVVCLILVCAGIALVLTRIADVDLLTAYLATSPGGMDAVAIIAAATNADLSFIMAFQTARLMFSVLIGPALAKFLTSRV